jgi:hypothetical protein
MNWTKELPKEDGYYWYREDGYRKGAPQPVEWNCEYQEVSFVGTEIARYSESSSFSEMTIATENGEFWPEKITHPSESR